MKFSLNDQIKKQMKHLHIVLSLLLLTSPLFGQTEETSISFHREENGKYGWYENGDEYNDRKYVGEIENGKPNGQGTETSPDGEKYVGEWKDGEKHGQGKYTLTDGNRFKGEWKDWKQWDLTIYNKNRNIIGKLVNGVLQK